MRNKKNPQNQKTPEQEALERRVDAMMDPKQPDPEPESTPPAVEPPIKLEPIPVDEPTGTTDTPELEPIPVKTAPTLSTKPRKKIPVDHAPPPLSIDKLEDLTGDAEDPEVTEDETPGTAQQPEAEKDGTELSADIDDSQTEKAVDDIVAHEGDVMLALQDSAAKSDKKPPAKSSTNWKNKLSKFVKNKRTWLIVIVLLAILFSLPTTRYKLIGLVVKEQLTVTVTDSKTQTPVSSAVVNATGRSEKTDANGKAIFKVSPGHTTLKVSKKYYKSGAQPLFVGLKPTAAMINLQATGRQVPVTVANKLTGEPLASAEIKVLGTAAKTNKFGKAVIVLPAKSATAPAEISLKGYKTAKIQVTVTDQIVPANNFALTPGGSIYFLSNASGTIDVVKTDLSGDNRHTVLAGTGREDPGSTSLLASRDWRYVVLKSRRDTPLPALYLIDTTNDKITQFDSTSASFRLIGWSGHAFAYDTMRNGLSVWQPSREILKSYDADNKQLNQLDQNQAEGSVSSFAYQGFSNFYILNDAVVYTPQWASQTADGSSYNFAGKTDLIRTAQLNGQGKKDYQSFPANTVNSIQSVQYGPASVYYAVYDSVANRPSYYAYENQAVRPQAIIQDDFSKTYPTYLISPSGNQTLWSELRDGRDSLLIGDRDARNPRAVANLSDYAPYGWYGDNYVLISRNSSELYILPVKSKDPKPYKITDYYKPAQIYTGYGNGYSSR